MKLHTFLGDFQATKIRLVSAFVGQEVEINVVKVNQMMTKEFKNNMPLKSMPVLEV